jgi:hypothetical protein
MLAVVVGIRAAATFIGTQRRKAQPTWAKSRGIGLGSPCDHVLYPTAVERFGPVVTRIREGEPCVAIGSCQRDTDRSH